MNIDKEFSNKYGNFLDTFFLNIGTKFYPLFQKLNFTPNTLTSFSLIFGLLSYNFFSKKDFILAAIFYLLSYSFDVLDGNYARHTGLVSKFGDYYDHIKDVLINILILFAFYKYSKWKNLNYKYLILLIIITIFLFITVNIQLGCREIYYKKNTQKNISNFLDFFTNKSCSKYFYNNLYLIRYIGCGTFILWVTFLIVLNYYIK